LTKFNERIAKDRTFQTWKDATNGSINKFRNFLCLVSDRAKALLKLSTHHCCTGVADLFHFLMWPVRSFKFSFARKLKTLAKEEKKVNAALACSEHEPDVKAINDKLDLIKSNVLLSMKGKQHFAVNYSIFQQQYILSIYN
jgi:hypothetical protein